MKRLFLIDGSYTFFRAFFAIRGLRTADGMPTNAIFGFTNMLLKVIRQHKPDYVVVAFDHPGKTFRDEMFDKYKANRPEPDEDLIRQIPYIKRVPEALNIPMVEVPGFEADDIIATLARKAVKNGVDVIIAAADKDFMQVVSKEKGQKTCGIVMYDDMKDRYIGIEQVRDKFGVTPDRVVDVQGLMGDSSDNIPGVKGIGPKGASQLVSEFGTIEEIYEHLDDIKPNLRKKLETDRENAMLSKKLATLRTDTPVEFGEELRPGEFNREKASDLFRELEFNNLLAQLESEVEKKQSFSTDGYRAILTAGELETYLKDVAAAETLSVDLETTSTDAMQAEIVGVAMAIKPGEGVYIPVAHRYLGSPDQIPRETALDMIRPVLEAEKPEKVGQNIKYDALIFRRYGIELHPIGCDTMVAAFLVKPDGGPFNMDRLSLDYLSHSTIKYEEVAGKGKGQVTFDQVDVERATTYAAEDADVVLRLVPILREKMLEVDAVKLWEEIDGPLLDVLLDMEYRGVRVDGDELAKLSKVFQERMREEMAAIFKIAGHEFNIDSPKQLQEVLFTEQGLKPGRRTKTGFSTDVGVLEKLAQDHPLPRKILDYRMLSKLRGTYVEALPKLIHPTTGRIHTSYNPTGAATGRLSSSDPNLQNIPVRTEEGRRIRAAFVPEEGWVFLSADYSQIELRVMAHLSGDKAFVKAFRDDKDVHAATADEVFGEVTPDNRRKAKAINFGIMYGMRAFGLAQRLGIPQGEAQQYIDTYFERYAGVKSFIDRLLADGSKTGYVVSMFGRRRHLPELQSKNRMNRAQAERIAVNAPIQGAAADILKIAMIRLHKRLAQEKRQARILLQVHDELVLESPKEEAADVTRALREEMEGACELKVPLKVDVSEGDRWSDLK